jgi:hypothetical protein
LKGGSGIEAQRLIPTLETIGGAAVTGDYPLTSARAKKLYMTRRAPILAAGALGGGLLTRKLLQKRRKKKGEKEESKESSVKLGIGAMGGAPMSGYKPPPLPKGAGDTPQQRLKKSQDIGNVGAFDQKTQGIQMQKFKPMSMAKTSFQKSQYSGPLSMGRFSYRSAHGMPANPPGMKVGGPPPPGEEEEMDGFKKKEGSLALAARNAIEAVGEWEVKHAAPTTPKGRLNQSMQVGAPKMTAPPGPSIAQISKPVGYGRPLPGATKGPI